MLVGLANTVAPFGELNDPAGDQLYELAPLAVNITLLPKQTLAVGTLIIGLGIIATLKVAILVQVDALPITVPVPIMEGGIAVPTTFGPDVVFAFSPLKPTHAYDVAPMAVMLMVFGEPL